MVASLQSLSDCLETMETSRQGPIDYLFNELGFVCSSTSTQLINTNRSKVVQDIKNTAPIDEAKCILNLLGTGQCYIREKATQQKLKKLVFHVQFTLAFTILYLIHKCSSCFVCAKLFTYFAKIPNQTDVLCALTFEPENHERGLCQEKRRW